MTIDWATVIATLASGVIGAGGAVLGVWFTTRSNRKLNEENRIKDKKQELMIALARWRGYLSKLMPEIKKDISEPLLSPENDPLTADLQLCIFLLTEYKFTPKSLIADFGHISYMLISMANIKNQQDYEIFIEEIKSVKFSQASKSVKIFYAEFLSLNDNIGRKWQERIIGSADIVFNFYSDLEADIYKYLMNR